MRCGGGNVIDAFDKGPMHRRRGAGAVVAYDPVPGHREEVAAPAAIAAARPEPRDLPLDNEDAQARVALEQGVGGPQARVPATDDGHVDSTVAGQRRPRREVVVDGVEPEAEATVAL